MTTFEALLLGFIQGVTEFFPVSSSAHLTLARFFMGDKASSSLFDLFCHLGTLTALLVYLRKDLIPFFRSRYLQVFFALLPLIPLYFFLKPLKETWEATSYTGFFLLFTALILFLTEFLSLKREETKKDGLWIGLSQCLAFFPGVSRSGLTISTARYLGWSPERSVEFSFFLSIPTIWGGVCLETMKTYSSPSFIEWTPALLGFSSSFLIGSLFVRWAIPFLKKGRLKPFAWYCLIMGLLVSLYFYG